MSLQPGFCIINSVYELMIQRPSNLPVRCNIHATRISTHFILSFPFRTQILSEQKDENLKILPSFSATIHQEAHTTKNNAACQRCHARSNIYFHDYMTQPLLFRSSVNPGITTKNIPKDIIYR